MNSQSNAVLKSMKYPSVYNSRQVPLLVNMRVVLFGSRAPGGSPRTDSDFDFALVVPNTSSKEVVLDYFRHKFPFATVDAFPNYGGRQSTLHLLVMNENDYNNPVHALSSNVRQGVLLAL